MTNAPLARARNAAAIASAVTVVLMFMKGIAGMMAGSSALMADAVHSFGDLLGLGTSWFGLALASRKPTSRFPYGFYRAETLAALVCSLIIIGLGTLLLIEGALKIWDGSSLSHPTLAIGAAAVSMLTSTVLSIWERRVSKATRSQSLRAVADESRMDAISSIIVLVALIATWYEIPYIEGSVTLLIASAVIAVGAKNVWSSVLALMDASLDPELEREASEILSKLAGIKKVEKLRARRSGPFYFLDCHVHVSSSMDVFHSHALVHEAEEIVRIQRPEVESVILHVEPYQNTVRRVLVPIEETESLDGAISRHFGRARCFIIATIIGKTVTDIAVAKNTFAQQKVRAGLAVINEFVRRHQLDAVLVTEIGEIAFHSLRSSFVDVLHTTQATAREAIEAYVRERLSHLSHPTHSSGQE